MLQSLTRCLCARRVAANVLSGSSPSIAYASRRSYSTGLNKDILDLLQECADKEVTSATKNKYKVRSFRAAAAAISKLDFKVQHGDDLKKVRNVGPGIRDRINAFFGHDVTKRPSKPPVTKESLKRSRILRSLSVIPGIGTVLSKELYDAGCDSVQKLELKKYKEMLSPTAKIGLKYQKFAESPVPRENAERLVEFLKTFVQMDDYEIIIVGDYRREVLTVGGALEILIVYESATAPIPTPPHPSTLKPPHLSRRPTRVGLPFVQGYMTNEERVASRLVNGILHPLENLSVVAHTTVVGLSSWQGWIRVPKKKGTWESKNKRLDGVQGMIGDFHRANISYIPKKSRGTGLLATTGDEDYLLDCARKAVQAGLYLNEWGLWEWQPDSQSLSRFKTSDAPHEKTSLGAMWGSETEADKGRWVQLETTEEEQVLNAIGAEYVPPNKRNFRFLSGMKRPRRRGRTLADE